ncbi:Elongation factor 1-gamma 1 [Stagonosporopsis vannaccii]|nr:Elongation factor 1-gamma 1 [Stagonosporopsis vannaccii]
MSSIGTIWTYPFNPRAIKIEAAAAVNNLTVNYAPEFAMGITNRSSKFLDDFPMGKVPTFKSSSGLTLFESDAIAQYAAESGPASSQLLGSDVEERAVIRQWISFADHELNEPLTTLILWRYGMGSFNKEAEDSALQRLHASLTVLEKHLRNCQWIASEQLSLADISVAAGLYWGFAQVIDGKLRNQYKNTTQWYLRVIGSESVKSAFGEKNFVEVRKVSP